MPTDSNAAVPKQKSQNSSRRTSNKRAQSGFVVQYDITPIDPAAHLFEVRMRIARPTASGQRLWLPAWIPGSYLIRDFARNIVSIHAQSGRKPVVLTKLDKHTWQAPPLNAALTVTYRVYAWDLSVRGAHLDQSHGFFNGTSVFLCAEGLENQPCGVNIHRPRQRQYQSWRVATTLTRAGARLWEFGAYQASDYDELIDHPVEMGRFQHAGFSAGGARHEIVITGHHDTDFKRLVNDLKPICEEQIKLFDPQRGKAPVSRYLFLTTAVGAGYGGLEHRASTALICARNDLPYRNMVGTPDGYKTFLGLASHEYFHTWNVKRIKPAQFVPYQLQQESYTELLWVFEGFTSYYDDMILARSGVISLPEYLTLLARNISNVQRGSGRLQQSVAQSSFDAWTRFYKQDENAANAIVSYYSKGAMVALALDLTIRHRSKNKRSLDDVMRLMWERFGRNFDNTPVGINEQDMPALIREATGLNLQREIQQWAHGTDDIALARLFKPFGIAMESSSAESTPVWLGARCADNQNRLKFNVVHSNGPAHQAGISAGDELVALDNIRIASTSALKNWLQRAQDGQQVNVTVFRADVLHNFELTLLSPPKTAVKLTALPKSARKTARWIKPGKRN